MRIARRFREGGPKNGMTTDGTDFTDEESKREDAPGWCILPPVMQLDAIWAAFRSSCNRTPGPFVSQVDVRSDNRHVIKQEIVSRTVNPEP